MRHILPSALIATVVLLTLVACSPVTEEEACPLSPEEVSVLMGQAVGEISVEDYAERGEFGGIRQPVCTYSLQPLDALTPSITYVSLSSVDAVDAGESKADFFATGELGDSRLESHAEWGEFGSVVDDGTFVVARFETHDRFWRLDVLKDGNEVMSQEDADANAAMEERAWNGSLALVAAVIEARGAAT